MCNIYIHIFIYLFIILTGNISEIIPEDGNLGTDFSPMVNGKPGKERKPSETELPEMAENVDNIDYYTAVNCFLF